MFLPAYPVQGRQEVLLGRHGGLVPDVGVVVEGLEVVEGAGDLVEELPQEGGAAAPGGGHQEVPHLAALLVQPRHPDINI